MVPLTKNEVKRDIRDIERLMDDETDSDGSVKSSDIMSSNYPVKPRKTLKTPLRSDKLNEDQGSNDEPADIEDLSAEDVIDFMKIVESARRGVFEAERERERLEIKYQVRN